MELFNNNTVDNTSNDTLCGDANCVLISANIESRSVSDAGYFAKCIVESFSKNVNKAIKADFNTLIAEITRNLATTTNSAELCNVTGTLQYNSILFKRWKRDGMFIQDEMVVHNETLLQLT